jgi:hypothetical protein
MERQIQTEMAAKNDLAIAIEALSHRLKEAKSTEQAKTLELANAKSEVERLAKKARQLEQFTVPYVPLSSFTIGSKLEPSPFGGFSSANLNALNASAPVLGGKLAPPPLGGFSSANLKVSLCNHCRQPATLLSQLHSCAKCHQFFCEAHGTPPSALVSGVCQECLSDLPGR